MRKAAVVLQKNYRRHAASRQWRIVRLSSCVCSHNHYRRAASFSGLLGGGGGGLGTRLSCHSSLHSCSSGYVRQSEITCRHSAITIQSQMRRGFNRLQATWRARKLTRDFRAMRARVKGFQRYCRGYITRQRFRRRLFSIIKLQSHFRKIIAIRKVKVMRIERQKRLEAERLRREEEERLRKQMAEEEAKKEAERLHKVILWFIQKPCESSYIDDSELSLTNHYTLFRSGLPR